jgi:hypothetical protein
MGAPAVARPRPAPKARPKPGSKPKRKAASKPKPKARAATPAQRTRASSSSGNVAMLPVNAVGGIADSGFVISMARSRVWIGVLGVLLGGIVAINVVGLSLSASGSQTSAKIDELVRDNSVQRSRLAHRLSNGRISKQASALGLAVPAPDAVNYLKSGDADAKRAAERLADGSITNAPPLATPSETATDPSTIAPATTTTTTVPSTPVTPAVDPATGVVTTDPALTTASTTP